MKCMKKIGPLYPVYRPRHHPAEQETKKSYTRQTPKSFPDSAHTWKGLSYMKEEGRNTPSSFRPPPASGLDPENRSPPGLENIPNMWRAMWPPLAYYTKGAKNKGRAVPSPLHNCASALPCSTWRWKKEKDNGFAQRQPYITTSLMKMAFLLLPQPPTLNAIKKMPVR